MEDERFLIGKDPADIELPWQACTAFRDGGGGPILNSAISASKSPLGHSWDSAQVPIYKLLGGAARSRIRMYLDVGSTPKISAPGSSVTTAAKRRRCPRKRRGASLLHDSRGPCAKLQAPSAKPLATISTSPWMRMAAVPPRCDRFLHPRRRFGLLFVEEPNQLEDLGELACSAADEKRIWPPATVVHEYGFADFCSRHLVDYIQPVFALRRHPRVEEIGVLAERTA